MTSSSSDDEYDKTTNSNEAHSYLSDYIQSISSSFSPTEPSSSSSSLWSRSKCCGKSRSLYCPDCCRILIPVQHWPQALREGKLKLPFHVQIVLTDRRASSTGIQTVAVMRASEAMAAAAAKEETKEATEAKVGEEEEEPFSKIELIDLERGDRLPTHFDLCGRRRQRRREEETTTSNSDDPPDDNEHEIPPTDANDDTDNNQRFNKSGIKNENENGNETSCDGDDVIGNNVIYQHHDNENTKIKESNDKNDINNILGNDDDNDDNTEGTFLLFPGSDSIPLSDLLLRNNKNETTHNKQQQQQLKTLVVLDCKWARSSIRLHPSIAALPRVCLSSPPPKSYYWRWHNAGDGMVSTIEAIYAAAWEVMVAAENNNNNHHRSGSSNNNNHHPCSTSSTTHPNPNNNNNNSNNNRWTIEERNNLVHLLWLFGLQRVVIQKDYGQKRFQKPIPFSEHGKEHHRSLRRKDKTKQDQ